MAAAEELGAWLKREHNVNYRWQGDMADISCRVKGISGSLRIEDETINLDLSLGMLASMFEGVLRQEINSYLSKNVY